MHFALLVLADGTKTLDDILSPYEDMGRRDSPYTVFEDLEDKYLEEYHHGTKPMVMVEGELVSAYDGRFRTDGGECVVPDGAERIDVPYMDLYDTFDAFALGMHGSTRDRKRLRHGYWHNPNSRWDWYSVGGRWAGLLEANVGGHGERSRYDFDPDFRSYPPYADGMFDVARVSDIKNADELVTHDVITPDGAWHSRDDEDEWDDAFRSRFIDPYQDCVAIVVDCHT